jgi:hypothetical protein
MTLGVIWMLLMIPLDVVVVRFLWYDSLRHNAPMRVAAPYNGPVTKPTQNWRLT